MTSSINTNRAALQGLAALNANNRDLQAIENRIATGLSIHSPKDNGAVWAIAQGMRAQVSSWQAVNDSLARGQSALDVASVATESVADLTTRLKEHAVAFNDASLDGQSRQAIRADMEALIRQIDKTADNATFDGLNLLSGLLTTKTRTVTNYTLPSSTLGTPAASVTMAAVPPGAMAASSETVTYSLPPSPMTPPTYDAAVAAMQGYDSQSVALTGGSTAGRISFLVDASGVADLVEIWQNGTRVAATGQPTVSAGAAVASGTPVASQSLLSFDYDPTLGQNLEFRFNQGIPAAGSVWSVRGLELTDLADPAPTIETSYTTSTTVVTTAALNPPAPTANPEEAAAASDTPPANVSATYAVGGGPTAGRMDVLFDAFDLPDTIEVFQAGDRIGASGQAYAPGGGMVGPASGVTGPQVISFDYDPLKGPLTFSVNSGSADPDSAWVVGAVTLRPTVDTIPAPQVTEFDMYVPASDPIYYDFLTSPDPTTLRVRSHDLTSFGLGLDMIDWTNPKDVLARVTAATETVIAAAADFGTKSDLLEIMGLHAASLGDVLQAGVGNLVDADMAKEAAKLQAAQIRVQLSAQSLSIANAEPQWISRLFGE